MKIGIIGAGIAGLATASMLAEHGFHVEIFEEFEEAKAVGAGLLLQPPGQKILDDLGVLDTLRQTSPEIHALEAINTNNKTILDVKYNTLKLAHFSGLGVDRARLHTLLLAAVSKRNIPLHLNHQVTEIKQSISKATIHFASGIEQAFDFIIAASGSKSHWIDNDIFGRRHKAFPWSCIWTTIDLPHTLTANKLHQRIDKARLMAGVLPISQEQNGHHKAAFYWSIKTNSFNPQNWNINEAIIAPLSALWPDVAEHVSRIKHQSFSHAKYYDVWCKRPIVNRIAIIGDAAHGTSPQLGQGVTSALLDAKAIHYALSTHETNIADIAKSYTALRIKHQQYIRYSSKMLTPFFQHSNRSYGWLRDIFMPLSLNIQPLKRLAAKTLASQVFLKNFPE